MFQIEIAAMTNNMMNIILKTALYKIDSIHNICQN